MRQQSGIAKYLRQLNGDLDTAIAAQKDSPVIYRSQFRDISSLAKLFLHHEDKTNIINIIQQGSRYHLDTIPTRTDIDRKVGVTQGGAGINTTPPHQIDIDSGVVGSVVHEGTQVTKPTPPTKTDRDNREAFSGVGGARGGRTQTDRLTGAAQDAVTEEAAKLVKDRTRLKVEAEVGRCRKKTMDWGSGGKRGIREKRTLCAHSEAIP